MQFNIEERQVTKKNFFMKNIFAIFYIGLSCYIVHQSHKKSQVTK